MDEQIKTIYEAILLQTGYTRTELNGSLSSTPGKRDAQRILIRILSRILSEKDIFALTKINKEEIKRTQLSEFSHSEQVMYKLVWKSYVNLMDSQLASASFA